MTLENQILGIKKNHLVILIIQSILVKKQMIQIERMIKKILFQGVKNSKIEKDLKIFHLKSLKNDNLN